MKLKQRFVTGLACLTFLTGCSTAILSELAAPVANFGLGLYNADTYYSKECAWYEQVKNVAGHKTVATTKQSSRDRKQGLGSSS